MTAYDELHEHHAAMIQDDMKTFVQDWMVEHGLADNVDGELVLTEAGKAEHEEHVVERCCGACGQLYTNAEGHDCDLDPFSKEVRAIAKNWGGVNSVVTGVADGIWRFAEIPDGYDGHEGFVYHVYAPGTNYAVYEDSGRPAGEDSEDDKWVVRCVNDAPDALFSVDLDGTYRGLGGRTEKIW